MEVGLSSPSYQYLNLGKMLGSRNSGARQLTTFPSRRALLHLDCRTNLQFAGGNKEYTTTRLVVVEADISFSNR